jgi:hypothetical protein
MPIHFAELTPREQIRQQFISESLRNDEFLVRNMLSSYKLAESAATKPANQNI